MKALAKWLCAIVVVFSLTGCIESKILIKVNTDGSGEIVETFLMSKEMLQMMAGLSALGEEGEEPEMPDLLDMDKLKEKTGTMGEGVTFASAEKVSTDKAQGYKAVYQFSDINKIMINQNPDENVPQPPAEGEDEPVKEFITFKFAKGTKSKPAVLTIINPQKESRQEAVAPDKTAPISDQEAMMMDIFKETFRDMKIDVAVEVNGKIVKTNAEHVDGRRVVLMELDFSKIVENEEALRTLAMSKNESLENTKAVMAKIPGIRVELKDKVEVQFK
ncbi:MAG TPA: hypothetical protein ENI15_16155 [Spirochaetes bacterium]|nr:hypothetical protein [Spirochaetota bacterium]